VQNKIYIELNQTFDLATNPDLKKVSETTFQEVRGLTLARPGFVLNRDFGTKHRFPSYPPISMRSATVMYDREAEMYHYIVVGIASDGKTKIYIHDPSDGNADAHGWLELTNVTADFEDENGNDPEFRWLVTDAVKKAILVYGNGIPLQITKQSARMQFGVVLPAGWYGEKHQLIPHFVEIGSADSGSGGGDLTWDAPSYDYGTVSTDKVRNHTITNNGIAAVTITSFSVESDFHSGGSGDKFFEDTNSTAPVELQPGQSAVVEVTANAVSGSSEPTTLREGLLSAITASYSVHKDLYGYFRDPE
jgi:hypothetical protein